MKKLILIIVAVLFSMSLFGCGPDTDSEPDFEGYVLQADKDKILLAEDVSVEKFNEIKDKSVADFRSDSDGSDKVGLVYISYEGANKFEKGDEIVAWVDGVNDSYPGQAKGEKVLMKE